MTRPFIILSVSIFLLPCSLVAQEEIPWLSLSRLSISASTSYHFSPWKKYNESLQLAQDAIRYDHSYGSPRGSFEKILGDGSVELSAGYRLIEGLSVNVIGGYISTSSGGNFSYSVFGTGPDGSSVILEEPKFNQNFKLKILEYGLGLAYNHMIFDHVHLFVGASASRAQGILNFDYEYQAYSTNFLYSANMQDMKYSYRMDIGISFSLVGPLSLSSSIEYRWLSFPDFQGDVAYLEQYRSSHNEYSESFKAQLGESDGYFGIQSADPRRPILNEHLLHILWQRTSVGSLWYRTRKPAMLDLSGIGIKAGVRFEF